MKVGDLVRLRFPRRRHVVGDCGVIIEKDRVPLDLDDSPNYFRVIWAVSQSDNTWFKQKYLEVINERTGN
jgi:hypothetical protein